MEVRFIKGADIDRNKWNSCVYYAGNGNIFGYKWYLDNVVKEWDAIVEGDYESVLPLISKPGSWISKSKLYSHPLLRSIGIYSVHVLSEKRIITILDAIPKQLSRGVINFNEGLKLPPKSIWKSKQKHTNAMILLRESYESISGGYDNFLEQQLERARLKNLIAVNNLKPEVLVDLYRAHDPNWQDVHYHTYLRIMYNALHRGWGFLSGVKTTNGELQAANFFTISNQRVMSLLPVETNEGKKNGALAMLFDTCIRIQAGKSFVLDFNVQTYGSFENQFGATESPFWSIEK